MFDLLSYLSYIANADYIVKNLPEIRKAMGNNFDVKQVFSNDGIFSNLGKVLCGKSFPRSNNIRYVDNILYTPDMNKERPDSDELDVMPSEYKFAQNLTNSFWKSNICRVLTNNLTRLKFVKI